MAINTINARHLIKRSSITGATPTIPPTSDFTDGTWTATDTRTGEFFFNAADEKLYIGNLTGFNQVQFVTTGSSTFNDAYVNEGIHIATGTNKSCGVATLSSGQAVVNTTKVTNSSLIFLTQQNDDPGGINVVFRVVSRVAGSRFTIKATDASASSTIAWMIIEPF